MHQQDILITKKIPTVDAKGQNCDEYFYRVTLNRPEAANALNPSMMRAILDTLTTTAQDSLTQGVIIDSNGKHFSAGADLDWMRKSGKMTVAENEQESLLLKEMFTVLASQPAPTIAVVRGACYGGAVGIVACCDYAIAAEHSRFCLSEAKIGLLPAIILPYLARKLPSTALRRFALTADVFSATDAKEVNLIHRMVPEHSLEETLTHELNLLAGCSTESHREFKRLFHELENDNFQPTTGTIKSISRLRASPSGQEGLRAFFAKEKPVWYRSIQKT